MVSKINTLEAYIAKLSTERKPLIERLRQTILKNLPKGFEETFSYGMIGYVIPHSIYPKGYHCNPKLPLPFINLASQKKYISLYHMGLYANTKLLTWFEKKYIKQLNRKPDVGKCCVRFKKMNEIPFELVGELCTKMSAQDWIRLYEQSRKK